MGLTTWLRNQWDRAAAWACVLAGALVLIIGYVGVSGTPYEAKQLPYIISGGLGGVFLLGVGGLLWLSADLRDEWVKLDELDAKLDDIAAALGADAAPADAAGPSRGTSR
jgi:hypothetical protein